MVHTVRDDKNPRNVEPGSCNVVICKRVNLPFIRSAVKELDPSQRMIDLMIYEDALKTTAWLESLGEPVLFSVRLNPIP